tara:strand:- start:26353 stop:27567 length:1215 start_codon:yes stop_codon:yes gene_type:complete
MIPAELPENEADRLSILRGYGILDTPPEERFDRLVRLVSEQLGVPIALVSLVDAHRQWFKAAVGLDAKETPRELAFCAHAIHSDETLVIENALMDERFSDNPLVASDPDIRFYAGSPLVTSSGHRVGTLCAIDRQPRTLTASEETLLRTLAAVVVDEMELTAIGQALEESAKQLENRNTVLDAFVHSLSHDLAGPIRRIKSFCDLLQEDPTADTAECLQFMADSAVHADRLLTDLRSFFSVGRAEAAVACDVRKCLERAEDDLKDEIQAQAARVEVTGSFPSLQFFPEMLTLVFHNLIGNSLKYRSASDPVISVHAQEHEDRWEFCVDDNGIGIPEKHRGEAFKLLFRLHREADIPGSGMGLAICQKIVKRGGGEMRIAASELGGTCVSFTLDKALGLTPALVT